MIYTRFERGASVALMLWAVAAWPAEVLAAPLPKRTPIPVKAEEMHSMTFSTLVSRVVSDAEVVVAKDGYRVDILEELRKFGYPALGAESVVFARDDADDARFVLGGAVRELDCTVAGRSANCGVGIEWELLDQERDQIVYRVTARHYEMGLSSTSTQHGSPDQVKSAADLVRRLFLGALRSLLSRRAFVDAVRKKAGDEAKATPQPAAAALSACNAGVLTMPGEAEQVLRATVMVESRNSLGTGVLVSPDGFVVTAAHVLNGTSARVQLRDGTSHDAKVIRVRKDRDVALLKIEGGSNACLASRLDAPSVGSDVFAVGSATSKELSFSVTRGVVSGTREFAGLQLLQTDASINPGNSGGPIVDTSGRLLAIVSFKLVDERVEGVAFGVPIQAALAALGVIYSDHTDAALQTPIDGKAAVAFQTFVDEADPSESIDPEGDHRRAVEAATPGYVYAMRWVGVGLMVGGTGLAVGTYFLYDDGGSTKQQFESARRWNDVGWIAAGVGALSFGASWFLVPRISDPSEKKPDSSKPTVRASVGPARVNLSVRF